MYRCKIGPFKPRAEVEKTKITSKGSISPILCPLRNIFDSRVTYLMYGAVHLSVSHQFGYDTPRPTKACKNPDHLPKLKWWRANPPRTSILFFPVFQFLIMSFDRQIRKVDTYSILSHVVDFDLTVGWAATIGISSHLFRCCWKEADQSHYCFSCKSSKSFHTILRFHHLIRYLFHR